MSGPLGRQIQLTSGGLGICATFWVGSINCTVVDGR
jgi:hypothetical protein